MILTSLTGSNGNHQASNQVANDGEAVVSAMILTSLSIVVSLLLLPKWLKAGTSTTNIDVCYLPTHYTHPEGGGHKLASVN